MCCLRYGCGSLGSMILLYDPSDMLMLHRRICNISSSRSNGQKAMTSTIGVSTCSGLLLKITSICCASKNSCLGGDIYLFDPFCW